MNDGGPLTRRFSQSCFVLKQEILIGRKPTVTTSYEIPVPRQPLGLAVIHLVDSIPQEVRKDGKNVFIEEERGALKT